MIPRAAITAWGVDHPWPTMEQIEQDLVLSRAICAIALHPYLGEELVFRGGTALHKLHLPQAFRYSEDLDYVRVGAGGIQPLTEALTKLGQELGFEVSTRIGAHPKVLWRTTAESGSPMKIKIEINTYERSPALKHVRLAHTISSSWWSGSAPVLTFQPEELVATKIRALYQRSKGRDLFDLWLALDHLGLNPETILTAFAPYKPDEFSSTKSIANLQRKLEDHAFRSDLDLLVTSWPSGYTVNGAGNLIIDALLEKIT